MESPLKGSPLKRYLCFFLLLVLVAAASRAEVTKVFVVEKPELGQGEKVSDWNQDKVMLRPPTDEEMSLLGKMLKNDVTSVHELKFHIFQGMLRERWIFIDKTPEDPPVD